MKIYLLDFKMEMVNSWKKFFGDEEDIEIVCDDFCHFMDTHEDVTCVVSPANSYGLMDGGYDGAITRWFGPELMKTVQKYIVDNLYGEQPVGTSIIVDTNKNGIKLIHTPTMRIPSIITDYYVVYQSMRTTLMCAYDNDIETIVIPAFGGKCGAVPTDTLAKMMWDAYFQVNNPPRELNWRYANRYFRE